VTTQRKLVSLPGGWPAGSPPRSAFFGLAPSGHNGESFESLTSYFRRLSAHHRILPRSLAQRAVVPLLAARETVDQRTLSASCYDLHIDGLSRVAAEWVDALEQLTLRRDLSLRTLLPLRNLVSSFLLISKRERFCPQCYQEDLNSERPMYNRLLWSIACVEACPLHKTLLKENPSASSTKARPFWVPGISRLDGSSLATVRSEFADDQQVVCARMVAELLDDVHHHPEVFVESRSTAAFLRYASKNLFYGQAAHLAKHIGIGKSELHGWMTEKYHPSLPRLVLIAYRCGCGISDVLLANKVKLRKVSRGLSVKCLNERARKGSLRPREELRGDLEKISCELGPTPTLRAAARLLDVSEKYLRRFAPDIAATIVAKGNTARDAQSVQRAQQRFECFRQVVEELTVDGAVPPLYKVRQHVYLKRLRYDELQRFMQRIRQPEGGRHPNPE
jgi:hypothetical protein